MMQEDSMRERHQDRKRSREARAPSDNGACPQAAHGRGVAPRPAPAAAQMRSNGRAMTAARARMSAGWAATPHRWTSMTAGDPDGERPEQQSLVNTNSIGGTAGPHNDGRGQQAWEC